MRWNLNSNNNSKKDLPSGYQNNDQKSSIPCVLWSNWTTRRPNTIKKIVTQFLNHRIPQTETPYREEIKFKTLLGSFSFRPLRQQDSNFANSHYLALKPLQFPQIHAHPKQNLNFSEYLPRSSPIHNQEQLRRATVQRCNNLLAHEKHKTKKNPQNSLTIVVPFGIRSQPEKALSPTNQNQKARQTQDLIIQKNQYRFLTSKQKITEIETQQKRKYQWESKGC